MYHAGKISAQLRTDRAQPAGEPTESAAQPERSFLEQQRAGQGYAKMTQATAASHTRELPAAE
jgi:hypothetical protein